MSPVLLEHDPSVPRVGFRVAAKTIPSRATSPSPSPYEWTADERKPEIESVRALPALKAPAPKAMINGELHQKEFWMTYQQTSRANRPSTTQLVELDFKGQRLHDLEAVLEQAFQRGFIDPKYRASTWWERQDGTRLKSSQSLNELFAQGIAKNQDSALRLVIDDMAGAMWFTYNYVNSPSGQVVAQRVKFTAPGVQGGVSPFEKLGHVTNHIFDQGYIPAKFRSLVRWEDQNGRKLSEDNCISDVIDGGFGVTEDTPLRLVIDNSTANKSPCRRETVEVVQQPLVPLGQSNGCGIIKYI